MKNHLRSTLFFFALIVLAALAACGTSTPPPAPPPPSDATVSSPAPIPAPPPARTLNAYKADVARHVMQRNPERVFEGELPPMLPAVVVLNITVDRYRRPMAWRRSMPT